MTDDTDSPQQTLEEERPPEQQAQEQQPESQQQEQQSEPEAQSDPKPNKTIGALRRAANEARQEAERLRQEFERYKQEMASRELSGGQGGADQDAERRIQDEVNRRVAVELQQKLTEERVGSSRNRIIENGVRDYGREEWNEKTELLTTMGALNRPEFMDSLVDLDNAHQVIVALADDPDRLQSLLAQRPAAMAAGIGRIAAELALNTTKPKEISRVPPPVRPVVGTREPPPPDEAKLAREDPKAYIRLRERIAPRHLGGRGQAA